jgi:tripeptide aminopeptidase
MRFLAIEGITGQEKAIGEAVVEALRAAGVPKKWIAFDQAHNAIPLPTQTGNLIVKLPGTIAGPRRLFSTHLDTVPLCAGAVPILKGARITAKGKTALGGDNRTGVACLVTMIATLLARKLPHQPTTVLFTVREESGLWGARLVDPVDLGKPIVGFNVDGERPENITIGAVGADRWEAEIIGRASHAGSAPEQGISATMVAALALRDIHQQGWFGKVAKDSKIGTSNIGSVAGADGASAGQATNVVTDYVLIRGESRSHDPAFCREITDAYHKAFKQAASQVLDDRGRSAKIRFRRRLDYHPFKLKEESEVVRQALAAAERVGWQGQLAIANGGLDANWLTRRGIPTITFGAGQNHVHTIDEYVSIKPYLNACRYALSLAVQ